MITREDIRESLAVQEWLEEGRLEGRIEGRIAGRVEGARNALKTILQIRFPELELDSAIQSIEDHGVLTALIQRTVAAPSPAAIIAAIDASSRLQA